ncbi:MAG: hypothetical protein A2428_16385 [Bdellovibrionales bacterium RIFOXYC1_FULL_54_43]|nr:MAG: hypothetical protein A2428_16385 [Bdellovibrionales bacterium RIFOXYC1_FULL_54_43]OFZ83955.1 MAG: hypothetical protein A2603_10410 [Bdellovibrionales bacterium RIFOXYD1_FULL_55_31]
MPSISAGILAFAASVLFCLFLRNHSHRFGLLDIPNHRSSHKKAIPRVGGIGMIVPALILSAPFGAPSVMLISILLLALLGATDDRLNLKGSQKLPVQLLIVFGALYASGLEIPFVALVLLAIWVAGSLNFYNFMDGIDGFAGAQALLVLGFLQWIFPAPYLIVFMGVIAGYLVWNRPKATLFMGDAGSLPLGFLIAAHGVASSSGSAGILSAVLFSLALNATFMFDAGVTLIRRLFDRKNIFDGHREHLYQQAFDAGVSPWIINAVNACATALAGLLAVQALAPLMSVIAFFGGSAVYLIGLKFAICLRKRQAYVLS